jgi:hypothetical protein
MSKPKRKLTGILAEFADDLKKNGLGASSVGNYVRTAQLFLKHVGTERIDRISEADTRAFFDRYKTVSRRNHAARVSAFLKFATKGLPAVIGGSKSEPPKAPTKKEIALRQKWSVDKLITEKDKSDDLVAKLARKVIDHYMYFEGRMKGEPDNLDDVARFADECRDLIQSNLALFMSMSAAGRNVHTRIDERAQL